MASKKVKIALGCLAAAAIVIIVLVIAGSALLGKLASNLNTENGKISYTDPKTGSTLNIGDGEIPQNFPSDFPIYPNAKVTSSLGGEGHWLTLSTADSLSTVEKFYEANLNEKGWEINLTSKEAKKVSWTVSRDKLNGYLIIDATTGETTIVIVIGETKTQE